MIRLSTSRPCSEARTGNPKSLCMLSFVDRFRHRASRVHFRRHARCSLSQIDEESANASEDDCHDSQKRDDSPTDALCERGLRITEANRTSIYRQCGCDQDQDESTAAEQRTAHK